MGKEETEVQINSNIVKFDKKFVNRKKKKRKLKVI
jgi:hypothetical protein